MAASLRSLLADELDTSPEKAEKLLVAMLREVKKRARREGVRLPEFGTFREENGQLTFEPSPSLARAVNHRFEGLESENLGSAPEGANDQAEDDDEGPNTITLGYQDSDWTPLDTEEDASDAPPEDEGEDTEEFQVPAAEEASEDTEEFQVPDTDAAADTDELQAPESTSPAAPSADGQTPTGDPDPATDTDELSSFGEDAPEDEEAPDFASGSGRPSDPDEHDSLSGIWDDEDEENAEAPDTTGFDPFAAEPEEDSASVPPSSSESDPDAPPSQSPQEVDLDPADREPAPPDTEERDTSTSARVGVGLLVVLLLGGAAWYVLGQRGTVQPPRETYAELRVQVQNLSAEDVPLVGGGSASGEVGTPPSATAEVEAETDDGAASTDPAAPPRFNPSDGGWTVIVASRTQRTAAESLVQKYRTAFADRRLPIGILTGTVENQTRYRVGVGQFESRNDAQQLLDEAGAKLPQGAWPLRLQ